MPTKAEVPLKGAICRDCKENMLKSDGCNLKTVPITIKMDRIKYQDRDGRRCHDCNCKSGQYHHLGCDMEICPNCNGQLLSCGCCNE